MKHSTLVSILVVALVVVGSFMFFGHAFSATDPAPTTVAGVAWAPNWGWLNFGDGTQVTFDANGNMTGQAWSPNLGWVVFDQALKGPTMNSFGVHAYTMGSDPSKYYLDGWFRACSVYTGGCPSHEELSSVIPPGEKSVSGTEMGGWDGWFKMKGATYTPPTTADGVGRYDGMAWGDLVGGWVNFAAATAPPDKCVGAACCTSLQTWDGSKCIDNPCDPTKQTCGGGGGSSLSVTCKGTTGTPMMGYPAITWVAETSGIEDSFVYTWYETTSPTEITGTIPDTQYKSTSQNPGTYSGSGWVYRKVLATGMTSGKTATGYCSYGSDAGACSVKLNCHGDQKTNQIIITGGQTISCNKTTSLTTCPTGSTNLFATGGGIWWKDGSCPVADYTSDKLSAYPVSGINNITPKEVCADFGGGAATVSLPNNTTAVDRPSGYPTFSRSTSNTGSVMAIGGGAANLTVDWGQLTSAISKAKDPSACGANPPQFCYKQTGGTIENCGVGPFSSIPIGNYYVRLKFPTKCPGTNGVSVFHKPGGSWMIPLSLDSGASAIINLKYNDPSISPI